MRMVYVEGGTFTMGCTGDQGNECESDETPNRMTTVGSFYIGMLEVTQSQWEKVMGTSISQQRNKANPEWPIRGAGPDYPMYYVSWEEAKEFCSRLSRQTGRSYTLPTEAEWEYAARGGNRSEGTKYSGGWSIDDVAWYDGNSSNSTHPCGTKRSNALGIYDMSGNVWEWCEDWYASQYLQYDSNNPKGAATGSDRVFRGGGWSRRAKDCRVASRADSTPGSRFKNLGFRVVFH
jgi:formylglycine-generating enzyme required for sulfatase activity